MAKTVITPEIEKYIRKNRLTMSRKDMGDKFGISITAVGYYLQKNVLTISKKQSSKIRAKKLKKPFTKKEDKIIIDEIEKNNIKAISKKLKRTSNAVSLRAKQLGFEKIIKERILKSRFQKGGTPANKGKKITDFMSAKGIENSKKTRYKKGNVPQNTKQDFDVSFRKHLGYSYWWIRIAKAKWITMQRFVWMQYNGEIPQGHNVQFIDGNTSNWEINNLYLISKNKQAIINKRGGRKIPFENQKTILLINQINQKIRNHEKQN